MVDLKAFSIVELKGKAYDFGVKLRKMQEEANKISQELNKIIQEIDRKEKEKPESKKAK